eukprot:Nitzschia sp. Nitz4//scaffold119_size111653//71502//73031//NITZ4_004202-RA/size111653-augustus-gene-0.229-mRNA-1//-1//CDS//3329533872//8551//frame0
MQFQFNADYPGLSAAGSTGAPSGDPLSFPPAQPIPCARITTRVFHPNRNQVATVQNVLVRTAPIGAGFSNGHDDDDDDDSFSSGLSSSSSDDSMKLDEELKQTSATSQQHGDTPLAQNAYWVQRTIREAIYGRVLFAVVLKRLPVPKDGAEWEVTTDHCAVKEMSWQHIRREQNKLAEDPIKEVSAMQYIQKWFELSRRKPSNTPVSATGVTESFQAMRESNIMMPLDLLTDERNLYSVMPYCDGGELFERLDLNERFSEEEARYWMDQVLNGIENLQHVGVCHRDMSLENLLVHQDGALVIDMGMCLMIPHQDAPNALAASFNHMTVNGTSANQQSSLSQDAFANGITSVRGKPRYLIKPQGTCGKWIYMSPEIYQNSVPFDGYAVDMWAAGVILFLMLTGFPPWERACPTDERFHYMTAGYLVQMLTEWEVGLSSDAMDLLQRMLFLDPKDRLSLDQVRAHPWMSNGLRAPPLGLGR